MEKVFQEHPALKECYKTSDGQCFFTKNAAENHAKTLEVKKVEHLERPSEATTSPTSEPDPKADEIKAVKKLNKEPLIAYAKEHFPEIEIAEEDNKETVLNKVLEAIEAKYATIEE